MIIQLLACSRDQEDPPVLAPLEDNEATWPEPVGGEPLPEVLSVVSGGDPDLWWAHGRGYVRASVLETWLAARDPEVGVDRREVTEWSVTPLVDPEVDESYLVHTKVVDILTVEYDVQWRHEATAGDALEPEEALSVWSKVDGSGFIDLLAGSLVIGPTDDEGTASVELVAHLKAALRDDETMVSYIEDLHASLVAAVAGEPLPTYP